ncbi:MAG: manganese efflux pump [Dethiobacteria bacterium]
MIFQLFLLCIAVSFDGWGAGFSYGARNLRIPFLSLLVISLSSALTIGLSMFLGWTFTQYFSLALTRFLGGGILVIIGGWVVWQGLSQKQEVFSNRKEHHIIKEAGSAPADLLPNTTDQAAVYKTLRGNFFQFLGGIIWEPQKADLDASGSINLGEAFLLGLALACDAFGAGFGVALAGFNPWLTSALVGISKFFLISLGLFCGHLSRGKINAFPAHLLSGGLLILLGIFNIL